MYCVAYCESFAPNYFRVFKCVGEVSNGISRTMAGHVTMRGRYKSKAEAEEVADLYNAIGMADEMDELP